jgi:hypothetical protein
MIIYGAKKMEYSLFDDEFWEAFKKFDETSKAFIAQCYREGLKNGKNGKDFQEFNKKQANRDYDYSLRK